jgi:hypothetical protein
MAENKANNINLPENLTDREINLIELFVSALLVKTYFFDNMKDFREYLKQQKG